MSRRRIADVLGLFAAIVLLAAWQAEREADAYDAGWDRGYDEGHDDGQRVSPRDREPDRGNA